MVLLLEKVYEDELETIPDMDPVDAALLRAEEALKKFGWCKGRQKNKEGEMCVTGALQYAVFGDVECIMAMNRVLDPVFSTALHKVADILGQANLGYPYNISVPSWNDDKAESVDEVISVLRKARNG